MRGVVNGFDDGGGELAQLNGRNDIRRHKVVKLAEGPYPHALVHEEALQRRHIHRMGGFNHADGAQHAHVCHEICARAT